MNIYNRLCKMNRFARRAWMDRLEVKRLTALLNEEFDKALSIQRVTMEPGSYHMDLQGRFIPYLASIMAAWFKESGALNYFALEMFHKDLGRFEFIMQRADGKTPLQAVEELKTRVAELEAELEAKQ